LSPRSATDLLAEIEAIGRDPATGGYRRFSWTAADARLRAWFNDQAAARGLTVEIDRNGNLWAYQGGQGVGGVVATGSHLDSVPDGGQFDGPLGVASAFAAHDLLVERGVKLQRPLAVVAFAEEEGARFGVPCLGSRLATGLIDPGTAAVLSDGEGISWTEAMTAAGVDASLLGPEPERLAQLQCFVELHIEQGRALAPLGAAVGLGTEIWPHGRWRLTFEGAANHAGTTSMADRQDLMADFASLVLKITDRAKQLGARATFGRVQVEPNATNAIPARVLTWLDARAESQSILDRLLAEIRGVDLANESLSPAVSFDRGLRTRIAGLLGAPPEIPTAAGHDAGILQAAGIPTAMLFVRNPRGISHSPQESASPEDCQAGVEALAAVIADLTGS
jgi:N-carbamoyl-L-amino-acid hydrolase